MAEKVIKHLQFWYHQSFDLPDGSTGVREQIARQGDTVDITDPNDLHRGEEHGAFFTDTELKDGTSEAILSNAGVTVATDLVSGQPVVTGAVQGATPAGATSMPDLSDKDAVVEWMEANNPNVDQTLELANAATDPEQLDVLLEAEDEHTAGDPRKGVTEGIERIAQRLAE